ncbi:pentatricopeptide repeat-containing protein At5g59600 [Amaranthus tricolor]|uniref:pentatricopeptide repeat-containing protein At5g59600 n=1 Tax=Amaranthus tricolor TaxID=29722 RepID=UPI002586D742|nr:pentatricopeptide repeat-containing protein At5g59600 [Amaranthus tricolor]
MFPIFRSTSLLTSYKKTHFTISFFRTFSDAYIKCIENYTQHRSLMLGKALHAHLLIIGRARSSLFASKLIIMYAECRELASARKVFDKMPDSNYRRWIALIGAYAKCGVYEQALDLLREMVIEGAKPNNYILPSGLKACGHLSKWWVGEEIHGFILRNSFEGDVYVSCSLIDMYSKCGFFYHARNVFNNMIEKDLIAVNAMVAGYVHVGMMKEALSLLEDVKLMNMRPDVVTWNTLIAGFSHVGDSLMVDELFQVMRFNGIEPDVVSWTSIISGFVKNLRNKEAFLTFQKMLDAGCFPNANTISTLLSSCANVGNVTWGKEIHGFAVIVGLEQDVYVRSALIDMYAKCGCIIQASILFQKTTKRNTPTWNSMIFGFANHGYCNEAIEVFRTMETEDAEKLNHLTFTAALTACSHGGRVELGRNLFKSMQEKYNIKPRLEHYACMVDLLGRAGNLTEAHDIVKAMPITPDLFVWGALLGASKQHGDIELAEVAAKHLSELEHKGIGANLLSTLYAEAGSWENAARLKKKKMRNFSGCSWIEATGFITASLN